MLLFPLTKCIFVSHIFPSILKCFAYFSSLKYIRICTLQLSPLKRLPWWLSGKELTCQCTSCQFSPCVRKIPQRRKWQTHSSILAQEISWTEEFGWLQCMGSQRAGHEVGTTHACDIPYHFYQCHAQILFCWSCFQRIIFSIHNFLYEYTSMLCAYVCVLPQMSKEC